MLIKIFLRFLFKNSGETIKSRNIKEIFSEESGFLNKLEEGIKTIQNGVKYFDNFKFKPYFNLILNKSYNNTVEEIILTIHSEKTLM